MREILHHFIVTEVDPVFSCPPPLIEAVNVYTAVPHLLIIVVAVCRTLVYLDAVSCESLTESRLNRSYSVLPKGTLATVKEVDRSWTSYVLRRRINRPRGVDLLKEKGCKKIKFEPNLAGLEWAKGTYPTPFGVIEVSAKKNADGTTEVEINAPENIKVIK